LILTLSATGIATAGTVTLQASGGGVWNGTPNTCTYSSMATDAAGSVVVTCQGASSGPTPPVILNAPNQTLTKDTPMAPLSLAAYAQTTDGDPILSYSYSGTLPAGLTFNTSTGQISGTPTTIGISTINWTASDKDGAGSADVLQITVATAPVAGDCPTVPPAGYTVQDYPNYSDASAVLNTQIAASTGLALRFTINKATYPFGYKLADSVGGSKTYTISKCPGGSDGPVDGQNGTTSVNGDSRLDNCMMNSAYVRYKDTSGASPVYYANATKLAITTSCFLPTTTAQGSSTAATYYLNIFNTGTSTQSIQFQNVVQAN
jgi:hypothetical protein